MAYIDLEIDIERIETMRPKFCVSQQRFVVVPLS
jgi:hypothetical protein